MTGLGPGLTGFSADPVGVSIRVGVSISVLEITILIVGISLNLHGNTTGTSLRADYILLIETSFSRPGGNNKYVEVSLKYLKSLA